MVKGRIIINSMTKKSDKRLLIAKMTNRIINE